MSFTLAHGLVASLTLHGALLLPFIVHLEDVPPEQPPLLVLELRGFLADEQSEQQELEQTAGTVEAEATPPTETRETPQEAQSAQAAVQETPPEEQTAAEAERPAPLPQASSPPMPEQQAVDAPPPTPPEEAATMQAGATEVSGADVQKQAQTIAPDRQDAEEAERRYVKALTRKLRENLSYPDSARKAGAKGRTWVTFVLAADGTLRPGSLSVRTSSGQARLDAAALKTVETSAPFGKPPAEMSVTLPIDFVRTN